MTPLERLGFAVAAARWLEVRPAVGSALAVLVEAAPNLVSLDHMTSRVGLMRRGTTVGALKVHICLLSAALRDVGHPDVLENVWGKGYRYIGDVAAIRAEVERFA